uniref:Uncharacterized protein n=1 Tax=Amphimedon queenslandica TaxID=400682 RepID=A0A1X7V4Q3_AMPQE
MLIFCSVFVSYLFFYFSLPFFLLFSIPYFPFPYYYNYCYCCCYYYNKIRHNAVDRRKTKRESP